MNKIKMGICGLGNFGSVCTRAFDMSKKAQVVAVCTRNEDVAKEHAIEFNSNWYITYLDMLEQEELDAVCITNPQFLHAKQSIAAMNKGLHVFCTKPMATTLKEADNMINAAKKNNVKLEIGFHYRFDKRIIKIKELIEKRIIGRPFLTTTSLHSPRGPEYWKLGPWRSKLSEAGGGALINNYIHEIDFLQWYFGPVEWVMGKIDNLVHGDKVEKGIEDVATAIIKFKNEVISSFTCSTAAMASKAPQIEIHGTEGSISLITGEIKDIKSPYPETPLMIYKNETWRTIEISDSLDVSNQWKGKTRPWTVGLKGLSSVHSLVDHIDEFITCILEDKEPAINGKEGIKSLEIVKAIYKSSKEGKIVNLPFS